MHPSRTALRRPASLVMGVVLALTCVVGLPTRAEASTFGSRPLSEGSSGPDVLELQIRIAGWYSNCAGVPCFTHFPLDGSFGPKTLRAVRNFEKAYGLPVNGRVEGSDYATLNWLESSDRSTKNFSWSEFTEKSATCTTPNKGTFRGGMVSEAKVRENVRRVMYRLQVVRYRLSDRYPIYITSGFRSKAYNDCLRSRSKNVASNSQHMYGTAADSSMKNVTLGTMRSLAKTSQIHAIFCYGSSGHNHFDIRTDESASPSGFRWPSTNGSGQDLDSGGNLCRGGYKSPPSTGDKPPADGPDAELPGDGLRIGTPDDPEGAFMRDNSEEVWMTDDYDE